MRSTIGRRRSWAAPIIACGVAVVATLIATFLTGAEGSGTTSSAPTPSTSMSSASSSRVSTTRDGPSSAGGGEDRQGMETHHGVDPDVVEGSDGAVSVATRFADIVESSQGTGQGRWWKEIKPLLSPRGVNQFRGHGVDEVGFSRRVGQARHFAPTVPLGEAFVPVAVPTDTGPFLVLVEQVDQEWKIASVSRLAGKQ